MIFLSKIEQSKELWLIFNMIVRVGISTVNFTLI